MILQGRVGKAFFSLLRAGLWKQPVDMIGCFPLSEAEWQALYHIARQQTVEGIVFDGVQSLEPTLLPPRKLLLLWLVWVEKLEQRNRRMNAVLAEQAVFFASCGIRPVLLKGQGIAAEYAEPLHRVCGDIDWYFSSEDDYHEANRQIKAKGIEWRKMAGKSIWYRWKSVEVEHHQDIFDIHNPFVRGYLKEFEQEEQQRQLELVVQEQSIMLPSPTAQLMQVNAHILKHLLSFGIGLRQLCDAARLYRAYNTQMDADRLLSVYAKTGILKWIFVLHRLLVDYLGLPPDNLPFRRDTERNADWMMEEIWTAGNFGFHDGRYTDIQNGGKRVDKKKRLWNNFLIYLPYAPMEAISFPFTHLFSRISR